MKDRMYVKPWGKKWLVVELNILESLKDDIIRFGWKIAILNYFKTLMWLR